MVQILNGHHGQRLSLWIYVYEVDEVEEKRVKERRLVTADWLYSLCREEITHVLQKVCLRSSSWKSMAVAIERTRCSQSVVGCGRIIRDDTSSISYVVYIWKSSPTLEIIYSFTWLVREKADPHTDEPYPGPDQRRPRKCDPKDPYRIACPVSRRNVEQHKIKWSFILTHIITQINSFPQKPPMKQSFRIKSRVGWYFTNYFLLIQIKFKLISIQSNYHKILYWIKRIPSWPLLSQIDTDAHRW